MGLLQRLEHVVAQVFYKCECHTPDLLRTRTQEEIQVFPFNAPVKDFKIGIGMF
jgi:hypothetical protein